MSAFSSTINLSTQILPQMYASTPEKSVVNDLPVYSELHAPPLVKSFTFRLNACFYARLITRALCERQSEGAIVRRWMYRGALAEGIDLNKPL